MCRKANMDQMGMWCYHQYEGKSGFVLQPFGFRKNSWYLKILHSLKVELMGRNKILTESRNIEKYQNYSAQRSVNCVICLLSKCESNCVLICVSRPQKGLPPSTTFLNLAPVSAQDDGQVWKTLNLSDRRSFVLFSSSIKKISNLDRKSLI